MKLAEALRLAVDALTEAKVPSPVADAQWLLCDATAMTKAELLLQLSLDGELSGEPQQRFFETLEARKNRVPLQHITGKAAFRDFEVTVGPGVFVPRPETELVAQLGIDYLNALPVGTRALDIGSGSGVIAIALAREVSDAQVVAVEASEAAAEFTKKNIDELAAAVELRVGPFQERVLDLAQSLDLVISNPPYIPVDAIPLEQEVWLHDPDLALYGGHDGLDLIREIIETAPVLLKPAGMLVLEHADGQSDAVCELLLAQGFSKVTAHADLTGRLRSVSAVW